MLRLLPLFLILFFSLSLNAQKTSPTQPYLFWVYFTDKAENQHLLKNPKQLVTERAMERRQRYNIAFDESDLPISKSYLEELSKLDVEITGKSRWLNAVAISHPNKEKLQKIAALTFVKEIVPVAGYTTTQRAEPTHTVLMANTTQSYNYGASNIQISSLGGRALHFYGYRGENMRIAVLDGNFNGVDDIMVLSSLRNEGRIIHTWDYVRGNANVYGPPAHFWHGTAVLCVMAVEQNNYYVGTAPKAEYILLRTEDESQEVPQEEVNWVMGAERADSLGADVINSSLGYSTFDNPAHNYTYPDMDGRTATVTLGAVMAARKGILVVVSAGNEGGGTWQYITAPADADSVLTVGAVDLNKDKAGFSGIGPTYDGRRKPNVAALGVGVNTFVSNGSMASLNGTSFAAPLMAGLATCLWQVNRNKTAQEIIALIEESAHIFHNPNNQIGHGVPDFLEALFQLNDEELQKGGYTMITYDPHGGSAFFDPGHRFSDKQTYFKIYDLTGRLIYSGTYHLDQQPVPVMHYDELSPGLYILRVSSGAQTQSLKFIK